MSKSVPHHVAQRLAAATAIFARDGIDGARFTDVAAATGVPRATLYYYFEGKGDLLGFLVCRWLDDVATAVGSADHGATALERLEAVVRALLEAMVCDPASTQVVLANLGRVERLPDVAAHLEGALYRPLAGILADGKRSGAFQIQDVATAALAIAGAVSLPVIHDLAAGRAADAGRVERHVTRMIREGIVRVDATS